MARQIVVEIVGDAGKFGKATDEAAKKGSAFGVQAAKGFGLGVGLGVFSLAQDAVSSFIGSLGDMDQAYKDDQVSQSKLMNALKNNIPNWDGNTTAVETYAGAQAKLGFEDDAVRDSIGQLIGITHDQTKAMELNGLAMDLARSKGIDLSAATDIVTKAAQGNGKALKGLGIDTQGATDAAGFLAAIHQNTLGAALDYSTTKQGLADAANVKNAESMEKIGSVVDKVASAVLPIAADAFNALADGILVVADAVEPVITAIVKFLEPAIKGLKPVFDDVMKGIKQIVTTVTGAINGIWSKWGKDISNVVGTVMGYVQTTIKNVMTIVRGIIDTITSLIKGDWGGVWRGIQTILGGVFDQIKNIVSTAMTLVKGAIGAVLTNISGLFSTAFNGALTLVKNTFNNIVSFISGMPGKIAHAAGGMWDGIWKAFKGAINDIIRGWNGLKFSVPSIDMGPLGKVGGFTIGTPNIPYLHQGGIVPGVPGSDVPAILQAGELVIPRRDVTRASTGSGDLHIHIDQGAYIDGPSVDRLARVIATRLRLTNA